MPRPQPRTTPGREAALAVIRRNIATHGYHVYVIGSGTHPRFAYTIGLSPRSGHELLFAGGLSYSVPQIADVLRFARDAASAGRSRFDGGGLGSFELVEAHRSWSRDLLLGAFDYYERPDIEALQIVPDGEHATIDTPKTWVPWDPLVEPMWAALRPQPRPPVPVHWMALTSLRVLRGERITHAARFGEDEWDLLAGGRRVALEEARGLPLGLLLAHDPSLRSVLDIAVGRELVRDRDGAWRTDDDSVVC